MSDPKDSESFFRKVVRFVANPATDWAELNSRQDSDVRETEMERSELKAMIERKRRNDFVRKREFDMLRKVRREGLTSEQLAALGGSSRIDDPEARIADTGARQDSGVKAKIDEIEQQMVGDGYPGSRPRSTDSYNASTQAAAMPIPSTRVPLDGSSELPRAVRAEAPNAPSRREPPPPPIAPAVMASGVAPLSPIPLDDSAADF